MRLFKLLLHSPGLLILHLSLLLIIAGGITTWLTAEEDMMMLRPGEPVTLHGFTVELRQFETEYYPGGTAPKNYLSHLLIDGRERTLEVNRPLTVNGWRLYQASYLPDGTSVISMRSDRPGTLLCFAGFALFALGGLLCLGKRFRLLALFGAVCLGAQAVPVVRQEAADSLARVPVYYQGRVAPYSTVAHDVMLKVYGSRSYKGLSAERTVLSLTLFPDEWNSRPIIKTAKGHISFNDCFDASDNYLLADDVAADERVGILLLLRSGELFSPLSPGHCPLSTLKISAEILYNRIPSTLIIFIILFLAAFLSFLWPQARWLGWLAVTMQTAVIALQCWLTGHGPFSSTFETLQFLVVVVAVLSLSVRGAQAPGLLAAGCMALVAHLQASNPMVTPLMPVLHSPWLSLHVSLVMTSYALFIVIAAMALRGLFGDTERMRRRALAMLHPAVYLLGLGIITGSVWANESWGRYWGWDPKETSALITFLLYAIPLHLRRPSLWWLILPLLALATTYFGTALLPSLHSYN